MTKVFAAALALGFLMSSQARADQTCIAASLQYSDGMVLCYGEHILLTCNGGQWKVTSVAPDPTVDPHKQIVNICTGMAPTLPMAMPYLPPEK